MTEPTHVPLLADFLRVVAKSTLSEGLRENFELCAAEIERLQEELAEEKKLSAAISRDCNAVALERNSHWSALGQMTRERNEARADYLRIHRMYVDAKYPESAVTDVKALEEERDRLRTALERIAKDPDFGASLVGPAHGAGMYTGWIIARDIARAALAGTSSPADLPPNEPQVHCVACGQWVPRSSVIPGCTIGAGGLHLGPIDGERGVVFSPPDMPAAAQDEAMAAPEGSEADDSWPVWDGNEKVGYYSLAEAIRIAKLWKAGKLLGADEDQVIFALLRGLPAAARDEATAAPEGASEPASFTCKRGKHKLLYSFTMVFEREGEAPHTAGSCPIFLESDINRLASSKQLDIRKSEAAAAPEGVSNPPGEGDNRDVSTERCQSAAAVSGTPESYSRSGPSEDARTPAGAGMASPALLSEDEYHVLRILGNGQISAAKARELINAIRCGNRPDLPLFEAEVRVPSEIDALVSRFLAWPLPKSVCSDLCVTHPDYEFPRSGTNLLTADEARQMIEYLLAPAPNAHHPGPRCGERA